MRNLLTSIILLLFLISPLFGQSSEDKKFAVRTSIFAHALTYNLDKHNGVGFHFGQLSTKINEDNIEKGYGNDVEDRVKKLSFQPISSTPFFAIGYSF